MKRDISDGCYVPIRVNYIWIPSISHSPVEKRSNSPRVYWIQSVPSSHKSGNSLKKKSIVSSIRNALCEICAIFLAALVPTLKIKIGKTAVFLLKTALFAPFPHFSPFWWEKTAIFSIFILRVGTIGCQKIARISHTTIPIELLMLFF